MTKSKSLGLAALVYTQVVLGIALAALCAVQISATRRLGIQGRTVQNFELRLAQNRQALGILIADAQQFHNTNGDPGLLQIFAWIQSQTPRPNPTNSPAPSAARPVRKP